MEPQILSALEEMLERCLFAFAMIGITSGYLSKALLAPEDLAELADNFVGKLLTGYVILFLILFLLFEALWIIGIILENRLMPVLAQIGSVVLLFIYRSKVPFELSGGRLYIRAQSILTAVGVIAVTALVIFYILYFFSHFKPALLLLTIGLDGVLVYLFASGYSLGKLYIAGAIVLTFLQILKGSYYIGELLNKNDIHQTKETYLRWIVCLFMLGIVVALVPTGEEPIDWSFVYRIGYNIRNGIDSALDNTGYFLSGLGGSDVFHSGYSSLEAAPGAIRKNDREELYIYTDPTSDNLYLTGNIKGDMDEIADDIEGRWLVDYLYLLYSHGIGREEAKLYGHIEKVNIEMAYLRTTDIIRPENVLLIEYGKKDERSGDGIHFEKVHKKGDMYKTVYLNVDYGSKYLEKLLMEPVMADYPSYDEMAGYCYNIYDWPFENTVSRQEYEMWTAGQRNLTSYLEEDEYFSERIKDLAVRIAQKKTNQYEICRLVEGYLRQYRYETGIKTGTVDNYVDDFLFNTGEGYCVHFATAMETLLRANGIPARYVEGYSYNFGQTKERKFAVTGSRAHSWVEAYIQGAGWIPFEPTPVKRTSVQASWNKELPALAAEKDYSEIEEDIPTLPEELQSLEEEIPQEIPEKEQVKLLDLREVLKMALLVAVGIVIFAAFAFGLLLLVRIIRYRNSSAADKYTVNMQLILDQIEKQFGVKKGNAMLLEDYIDYIPKDEEVPGENIGSCNLRNLVKNLISVMERQRFGDVPATDEEVRESELIRNYFLRRRKYEKRMY